MKIFRSSDIFPDEFKKAVIVLGNFDGVHTAHREVIKQGKLLATRYNTKLLVLTFDPHPAIILSKVNNFKYLISLDEKINLLKVLGVDGLIIEDFTNEFSLTSAKSFIKDYLINKYNARHIVTGYNFFFGHKGNGNANTLRKAAPHFKYSEVAPIESNGMQVSSSKIKELLSKGRIAKANKLLGRHYEIKGIVTEKGKIEGKTLNIPITNVDIASDLYLPLSGVYLIKIEIEEKILFGIASLGHSLMAKSKKICLEVCIFEFNQNIYGKFIQVKLLTLIRPERKFKNLEALKEQIKTDIIDAEFSLANLERHIPALDNFGTHI